MLLDTSVLLRFLQANHPQLRSIRAALAALARRGRTFHIVPQNLVEFWVVATRPTAQNGMGLSASQTAAELAWLRRTFVLLPETHAIFAVWESLVSKYQVLGKPAHDARLVAAMQVHGLTAILTFDRSGFSRFTEIEVVSPEELAAEV